MLAIYLKYQAFDAGQLSLIPALGFGLPLSDYAADDLCSVGNSATFFDMRGIVHFKANNALFIEGLTGHLSAATKSRMPGFLPENGLCP